MSFWTRHQVFEKNSIVLIVGILQYFSPLGPAVERIQPKVWASAVARPYLDRLPGGPSFLLIGDVRKLLPQRPARPAASRGSESRQPEHERAGGSCGSCRTLRS